MYKHTSMLWRRRALCGRTTKLAAHSRPKRDQNYSTPNVCVALTWPTTTTDQDSSPERTACSFRTFSSCYRVWSGRRRSFSWMKENRYLLLFPESCDSRMLVLPSARIVSSSARTSTCGQSLLFPLLLLRRCTGPTTLHPQLVVVVVVVVVSHFTQSSALEIFQLYLFLLSRLAVCVSTPHSLVPSVLPFALSFWAVWTRRSLPSCVDGVLRPARGWL